MGLTASSLHYTKMEEISTPSVSSQAEELPPMPRLIRSETIDEKLYRKLKSEPLIPIGCLTTAYFLGSGIKSFYNRDTMRSQHMMRSRVVAQFATLMIFVGYAGSNAFNLNIAPGYQNVADNGTDNGDKKEE
mmetsp:Transcript_8300/g.7834  ORF Transcript_8300/g.7834 Transcript_8300/m.7834 type:complete len:132 (-) Transcript_8300:46-441(-)|eukprot:CAMPEP_0197828318 /NCGR_PEP_ID=MMETSP1437-20131217/4906_1 /TAXON_ID=49252 ORGANISM="Eucampia antarctica, Strain CCMP1452" /NCGR_SAMPLE_ID=MMETSP1437 /ASSEMBLY_ACC=CAM_ASM_001096 /LENGTH=131 /DNA_ID=CAMNT_0043429489 /DNA_START=74 /DNA_END=469 /DNA_ORIENTATION=+